MTMSQDRAGDWELSHEPLLVTSGSINSLGPSVVLLYPILYIDSILPQQQQHCVSNDVVLDCCIVSYNIHH